MEFSYESFNQLSLIDDRIVARLISSHMLFIGLMTADILSQGTTENFISTGNAITLLALWHGANSYIKMYSASPGNYS